MTTKTVFIEPDSYIAADFKVTYKGRDVTAACCGAKFNIERLFDIITEDNRTFPWVKINGVWRHITVEDNCVYIDGSIVFNG